MTTMFARTRGGDMPRPLSPSPVFPRLVLVHRKKPLGGRGKTLGQRRGGDSGVSPFRETPPAFPVSPTAVGGVVSGGRSRSTCAPIAFVRALASARFVASIVGGGLGIRARTRVSSWIGGSEHRDACSTPGER